MPVPHTQAAQDQAIQMNLALYNDPEYQALLQKTKDWHQGPQPPRAGTLNKDGTISAATQVPYQQLAPKRLNDVQAREYAQTVDRVLSKYGFSRDHLPEGFILDAHGEVSPEKTWWETWKEPILISSAMVGGALLAPYIGVGAGGSTGATATGGGTAVGGGLGSGGMATAGGVGGTGATAGGAATTLGAVAPTAAGTTAVAAPVAAGTTAATTAAGTTAASTIAPTVGAGWLQKFAINKGIELGGNLLMNKITGSAAEKAADARKAGIDQATAEQRAIYNQSRGDLAPYRNVGGNAMSTLGALMGLGGGGGAYVEPNAPLNLPTPAPTSGAQTNPDGTTTRRAPPTAPIVGHAYPRGTFATSLANVDPAKARTESSVAPSGQMVNILAPTGQMKAVPIEQKDYFVSKGGQVVA